MKATYRAWFGEPVEMDLPIEEWVRRLSRFTGAAPRAVSEDILRRHVLAAEDKEALISACLARLPGVSA